MITVKYDTVFRVKISKIQFAVYTVRNETYN